MANWKPVCPEQLCERAGNCPTETESDVECVQDALEISQRTSHPSDRRPRQQFV